MKWQKIHDFLYGFGYLKEDETGTKRLFLNDLLRFKVNYYFYENFTDEELDELYYKVEEAKEKWRKENPTPDIKCEFKSISIPKVNKPFPSLDGIAKVQPMSEPKGLMALLKMKQPDLKNGKKE